MVPETTNNIQTGIVTFLLEKGHSASRINTTGIYDVKEQRFRTSNSRKGFFDTVACIKPLGLFATYDVKKGADVPSDEQLEFQAEVRAAGGIAEFVPDYAWFVSHYNSVILPLIQKHEYGKCKEDGNVEGFF